MIRLSGQLNPPKCTFEWMSGWSVPNLNHRNAWGIAWMSIWGTFWWGTHNILFQDLDSLCCTTKGAIISNYLQNAKLSVAGASTHLWGGSNNYLTSRICISNAYECWMLWMWSPHVWSSVIYMSMLRMWSPHVWSSVIHMSMLWIWSPHVWVSVIHISMFGSAWNNDDDSHCIRT